MLCFLINRYHVDNHTAIQPRHMDPAIAHKVLETMSVFEQSLLEQTGQETLIGQLKKKQDQ